MSYTTPTGPCAKTLLACALSFMLPLAAAEKPISSEPAESRQTEKPASGSEIEQLKRMIADQQRQIDELRHALEGQKNAPAIAHTSIGEVASTSAVIPPAAAAPASLPPQKSNGDEGSSPLQFRIGDAYITPVGFMDFTTIN